MLSFIKPICWDFYIDKNLKLLSKWGLEFRRVLAKETLGKLSGHISLILLSRFLVSLHYAMESKQSTSFGLGCATSIFHQLGQLNLSVAVQNDEFWGGLYHEFQRRVNPQTFGTKLILHSLMLNLHFVVSDFSQTQVL